MERKNTFMANRIKKKEETKSSYQDNVALIMGMLYLSGFMCAAAGVPGLLF